MKITAIETLRTAEFANVLWARVHTDAGVIGLGETFYGAGAVEAHIHDTLAGRLLGRDPLHIEAIHRDPEAQFNAEVITAGIEAAKTAVQTALAPPAAVTSAPGETRSIYVISDAKDRKDEALLRLRKCLSARRLKVMKPAFEGTAEEVRTVHEGNLAECDAVLIYYGCGSDAWKQSIDRDIQKAKGRGGGGKLRPVFNWIAAPTSDDKEEVISEGEAANLIDARGGVSQSIIDDQIVKVVLRERA